jgi:GNAT superfamily N-acetyltransferase
MGLDRERVLELQRRGLRAWIGMLGRGSQGARLVERDRVSAAVVPACATRSIPNSVSYTDASALLDSLEDLARVYSEAGVEAWTVWVPEFDREAIAALEAAGHVFDGEPAAMALELDRFESPETGDLDWDATGSLEELGRLNDLAYGVTDRGYAPALVSSAGADALRIYRARADGEPACIAATIDHGEDLGFYFVATPPAYQRRGLASRLLAVALTEGADRGLRTSSLQASAIGEPVYRRLGFESSFRMNLYERRLR